ncbi:uncharacterized protein F4822DRAFT_419943 [Hypoxylon trugodes]|uniref:uncharacterized protein n=1 Tax=Hypoxylon trugodes TaxID=326681 RepID=UPI002192A499|nr:uncharacterized protein F4822DRAFT_419943 [Hypoxylon trugodes]KAI1383261.1 hypothetical protein F4822DRAFT_419943 [Hypoxylon trugodes]
MPSVTPFELPMLSPTKKRRREGTDDEQRFIFPSTGLDTASLINKSRKIVPLPASKRFRLVSESEEHYLTHNASHISHSQQSHLSHAHPEHQTALTSQHGRLGTSSRSVNTSALLSPCHICHRKPTKKSDLDSFADCMGCGQRACFICIRACQGWLPPSTEEEADLSASFTMRDVDDDISNDQESDEKQEKGGGPEDGWMGRGHREMVCSRCCVERGSEGDVVCLGCLAGMEGA